MYEINWMAIAAIIIPSIATLIGSWWQARSHRAAATPAQNQPKARRSLIGFVRKNWGALLMTVGPAVGVAVGVSVPWFSERWFFLVTLFNAMMLTHAVTILLTFRDTKFQMDQRLAAIEGLRQKYVNILDTVLATQKTQQAILNLQNERDKEVRELPKRRQSPKKLPKKSSPDPPTD